MLMCVYTCLCVCCWYVLGVLCDMSTLVCCVRAYCMFVMCACVCGMCVCKRFPDLTCSVQNATQRGLCYIPVHRVYNLDR